MNYSNDTPKDSCFSKEGNKAFPDIYGPLLQQILSESLPEKELESYLQESLHYGTISSEHYNLLLDAMKKKKRESILNKHNHNIWQGADGNWYTYVSDNTKPKNRRRIKRATRDSLEEAIVGFLSTEPTPVTVRTAFEEWISWKTKAEHIIPATITRYRKDADRYFTELGAMDMKELSFEDLVNYLEMAPARFRLKASGYRNLKIILRGTFLYARRRGYTRLSISDVIESAIVPRKAIKISYKADEDEVYSVEEADKLIHYLVNNIDEKNLALLLIYLTGLRVGEVTTIKHCNVFSDHIRVQNTQTRWTDNDGIIHRDIKNPKTEAGFRSVPIPSAYHWVLEELKARNPDSQFVFMGENGLPYSDTNINNRLRRISAKLGIKYKSTHKLRKTFATILEESHVDDQIKIKLMGHTDIQTTRKFYIKNRRSDEELLESVSRIAEFQKDYRNTIQ